MCNHQSPCGLLPPHGQVVPPRPTPLLWGTVASFGFLLAGYALMLAAPNIAWVLVSTFVRSIGACRVCCRCTLRAEF